MSNDKHNPVVPFSEMREALFNAMKEKGFVPTDIEIGDGYFIFDMGDGGNVHFHVKGLRGWKFGLWCHDEYVPSEEDKARGYKAEPPRMEVFAQVDKNIDKFKPSRSAYCETIKYSHNYDENYNVIEGSWSIDEYSFYDVISMLKEMKYHPLMAYYKDSWTGGYTDKSNWGLLVYYIRSNFSESWYAFKKKWKTILKDKITYHYLNHIKNKLDKLSFVDSVEIKDNNDGYWICSSRYDMKIIFGAESDEIKEIEILKKYFHDGFLYNKIIQYDSNIYCFNKNYLNESGQMISYWYDRSDFDEE